MLSDPIKQLNKEGQVFLKIKVKTAASKTTIKSVMADGTLKIDVAAAANENKANLELVKYLAKKFKLSIGNISIITGKTGKTKLLKVKLN